VIIVKSRTRQTWNVYRNLVRKPLGRLKRRWEDHIKIGNRELGCGDGRWMKPAQDRVQWRALVLAVLKLRILLLDNYLNGQLYS